LNPRSLSKVIERTTYFDNGRTHGQTHAQTGVTLNAPPPFFEWRGHKNTIDIKYSNNNKYKRPTESLVEGILGVNNRGCFSIILHVQEIFTGEQFLSDQ